MTTIDAASDRAIAADRWRAARESAATYAAGNADLRRDQRVEGAMASAAARPRPQDRTDASDERARPSATARLFDVIA